jgi:UDP-N-acetylmuramoyl-tripeptide--D-alanyl-D-alanine ligase
MDVSITEVLEAVDGKVLGEFRPELCLRKVSTDTRLLAKDDLFFALKGARFDGHDFIEDAIAKGARHFVVSSDKKIRAEFKKKANFILVEDTLKAYGDLAKACLQKFKIPVVAVTGSVGKTTAKELIAHVLSSRFKVLKNRGTENNLIGVPKTIFQLEKSHEALVLEMGTNCPGEIDRLASLARPQVGVLTRISHSHLEGLKSLEGVREEKLKLVRHLQRGGILLVNGEDPFLASVTSGVHKVVRVGFSKTSCDFAAERIECHEAGSSFSAGGVSYETQLLGRHNILHCLFAVQVGLALGLDTASLKAALASFKPVPGRLCLKNLDGTLFIDDSYNSNPSSFRAALETLKSFKTRGKKGVLCGDMLELGEQAQALHREIGKFLAQTLFDYVIAAGAHSAALVDEALKNGFPPSKILHATDSAEAGKAARKFVSPGDTVLVKGSRGMQMEKVFECFITSSIR